MEGSKENLYEEHYVEVSSSYDYLLTYHHAVNTSIINRQLQFTEDDTILDIGGGTAEISHRLWKMHHLKTPVLCVDPSETMLEIARSKEGVKTVKSTAEEFFLEKIESGALFSKIMIAGAFHHFTNPSVVFSGIAKALSDNGVCIVLGLAADSAPHCFMKAPFKEIDVQLIAKVAESAGLKTKALLETEAIKIEKKYLFDFLRQRTVSSWYEFTDAEIEKRIEEMEQKYGGQKIVDVDYKVNVAIITK